MSSAWRGALNSVKERYDHFRAKYPTLRAVDAARWAKQEPKERIAPRWSGDVEVFERDGLWVRIELKYDEYAEPPWEQGEEGAVRGEREYFSRYGERRIDRNSGDYILESGRGDDLVWTPPKDLQLFHHAYHLRDFHGYAMQPALDEARRQIEERRRWLERWINDDWCYVALIVTLHETEEDAQAGRDELAHDALHGIDYDPSDPEYLDETAHDMVDTLVGAELKDREEAALQERIDNRFHDAMENGL